jgi:hypothetical protein
VTFLEYWVTWGVAVGGAGLGVLVGHAVEWIKGKL